MEEIDFEETGCFWLRVVPWMSADLRPMPQNYLYRAGLVLKISSKSVHSIKSYLTFSRGTHLDIHIQMGKIFNTLFDTFHFTIFALLTLFERDKMS